MSSDLIVRLRRLADRMETCGEKRISRSGAAHECHAIAAEIEHLTARKVVSHRELYHTIFRWTGCSDKAADECADAILALLETKAVEGEGWVLAPINPTEPMCVAGWKFADTRDAVLGNGEIAMLWSAMLNARPQPPHGDS